MSGFDIRFGLRDEWNAFGERNKTFLDRFGNLREALKRAFTGSLEGDRTAQLSCALGFSWTLDCERVLAGGVSR